MIKSVSILLALVLLSGCSTRRATYQEPSSTPAAKPSAKDYRHPTMRPYVIHGKKYYPTVVSVGEKFYGRASWYGPDFHGKLTSNGETYDMHGMTAAHKTLPMNTIVRVTNRDNNKVVVVRINDRGPFVNSRIIDLSKTAATKIDMVGPGTANVEIEILGFQPNGSTQIADIDSLKKGPSEQVIGSFAIQIGSFTRFEGASATQEKYDNTNGYHTIIKDTVMDDKRFFRVWLTGFKSEDEARDFISTSGFEHAFIVQG